jgi:transitional endoplasmic reticulum ATPase
MRGDAVTTRQWRRLFKFVSKFERPDDFDASGGLSHLQQTIGLDQLEVDMLAAIAACQSGGAFELFGDALGRELHDPVAALSMLIGQGRREVSFRCGLRSNLVSSGCLTIDPAQTGLVNYGGHFAIPDFLRASLSRRYASLEEWRETLVGRPVIPALALNDFDHVAQMRDHVGELLVGALETRARGINVLVYGPVGTGKTEFCKAIAAATEATLTAVGEEAKDEDDATGEPTRSERLAHLRFCDRLLGCSGRSLLLFDEMEDISLRLSENGRFGSKAFLNRFLESNAVPVLWTANDLDALGTAVVRRMAAVVELRVPSAPVRERIWRRVLASAGIEASPTEIGSISREYAAPPAVAQTAARSAALSKGGMDAVRLTVGAMQEALADTPVASRSLREEEPFQRDLINVDGDLDALYGQLSRPTASRRFSLLVDGLPGTGKSAFVRDLARKMNLAIVQKRASDLMSMWVGETERLIASAFKEAEADGAFLVFDEADSLLADRRSAERSWEISQVNEMLTWMERHPLPFACTTNFIERLDRASLRRFVFKLHFAPMSPNQVRLAFKRFFGLDAPIAGLQALALLTPGDFAVVRRKARILDVLDAPELVRMLKAEEDSKCEKIKIVGFQANR